MQSESIIGSSETRNMNHDRFFMLWNNFNSLVSGCRSSLQGFLGFFALLFILAMFWKRRVTEIADSCNVSLAPSRRSDFCQTTHWPFFFLFSFSLAPGLLVVQTPAFSFLFYFTESVSKIFSFNQISLEDEEAWPCFSFIWKINKTMFSFENLVNLRESPYAPPCSPLPFRVMIILIYFDPWVAISSYSLLIIIILILIFIIIIINFYYYYY